MAMHPLTNQSSSFFIRHAQTTHLQSHPFLGPNLAHPDLRPIRGISVSPFTLPSRALALQLAFRLTDPHLLLAARGVCRSQHHRRRVGNRALDWDSYAGQGAYRYQVHQANFVARQWSKKDSER